MRFSGSPSSTPPRRQASRFGRPRRCARSFWEHGRNGPREEITSTSRASPNDRRPGARIRGWQARPVHLAGKASGLGPFPDARPARPRACPAREAEIPGRRGRARPAKTTPPAPANSCARRTISRPRKQANPATAASLHRRRRGRPPARLPERRDASILVPWTEIENAARQSRAPPNRAQRCPGTDAASRRQRRAPSHNRRAPQALPSTSPKRAASHPP